MWHTSPTLYYTDSHGPDETALAKAFAKFVELVQVSRLRQGGIATVGKRDLSRGVLLPVLGEQVVKQLAKGKAMIEGCEVFLLTERIDPHSFAFGPILAVHILPKYLARILNGGKATDIVYVPWTPDELTDFLSNHPDATPL